MKIKKFLPAILSYLFVAIICLYYVYTAPVGFKITPDGENYLKMAESLVDTRLTILGAHWQKMLGPWMVGIFSRAFHWSYVDGFLYLCQAGFFALALFLLYQLQREIKSYLIATALTLVLLLTYWTIKFNLYDFYQLCDLLAYVLGLGALFAFRRNQQNQFFIFSALGSLNRQNFWFLSLSGAAYFVFREFQEVKTTRNWKHLGGPIARFFLLALISGTLLYLPGQESARVYFRPEEYVPGLWFRVRYLTSIAIMLTPFWPGFLLLKGPVKNYIYRYWPLLIYVILCFAVPFNSVLKHEEEAMEFSFVERITYQGLWLFHVMSCLLIGKRMREMGRLGLFIAVTLVLFSFNHKAVVLGGTVVFLFLSYEVVLKKFLALVGRRNF